MFPNLTLSTIDPLIVSPLLSAERPVEVWTSLLSRLYYLPTIECSVLLSSLDIVVEERDNYLTPMKNKRPGLVQSSLKKSSFIAPPIVDPTVDILTFKSISFLPLFVSLCEQVSSFQEVAKTIRVDSVAS